MKIKISGYKQLFLTITFFVCLFSTILISALSANSTKNNYVLLAVIFSLVLMLVVFLIKDKYYMRLVFSFYNEENEPDYFMIYAAKIISLDSHFSENEKKKVLKYMDFNYGAEYSKVKIINLELIVSEIDAIFPRFKSPGMHVTRGERLRLLQNIVGIAVTDRFLSNVELNFIKATAKRFGLTERDLSVVLGMYNYVTEEESEYQRTLKSSPKNSMSKHYEILGLVSSCSFEEVKQAYRELVKIYHPDKQNGSKKEKQMAKVQFQKIAESYEIIKAERGI